MLLWESPWAPSPEPIELQGLTAWALGPAYLGSPGNVEAISIYIYIHILSTDMNVDIKCRGLDSNYL